MLRFKPVTASVGPRILLSGMIFTVVLITVALLIAFILSGLPHCYPFWKSAEGIAVAEVVVALLLSFGLWRRVG